MNHFRAEKLIFSRYFPFYGIFRTKHENDLFLIGTSVIGA